MWHGAISDEELREAIIKAMNLVPDKKEDLIRLQERLRWGGLAKADEVLAAIETEMGSHSENYEEKELKRQWEEVSEKRAIYADKEWQTRILLERMGQGNTDAFVRETQPVTTTDDDAVRTIKSSEERRHEYVVMMIRDMEKIEEGKEIGKIIGFVDACRDDGKDDQTIISRLVSKYGLTQEEAKEYVLPAVGATV